MRFVGALLLCPCLFPPSDNVWRSRHVDAPRCTHFSTVISPSWITEQISVGKCAHRGVSACRERQTSFKIVSWTKQTWTKHHNTVLSHAEDCCQQHTYAIPTIYKSHLYVSGNPLLGLQNQLQHKVHVAEMAVVTDSPSDWEQLSIPPVQVTLSINQFAFQSIRYHTYQLIKYFAFQSIRYVTYQLIRYFAYQSIRYLALQSIRYLAFQ